VFQRLIGDLRARGPLQRNSSEVGVLLTAAAAEWPSGRRLPSRADGYTRSCAYRDSVFEILLLNWAPGGASPIHDHGDQHCWLYVIDGVLEVDDYVRLDPGDIPGYAHVEQRGSRTLEPGGMDLRSGRFDLHRVAARSGVAAVSLHLYSAPLRQYLVYDEAARRCETAFGTYDEFLAPASEPIRR